MWLAKTEKQRRKFEARCVVLLNKWALRLDLDGWDVGLHFAYDTDATEEEHDSTDLLVGGHVVVEPGYRRATVTYQIPNTQTWCGVSDQELNEMLLHELLHIVTALLADAACAALSRKRVSRDHYIYANEHTVSWLTAIVRRGYEPPAKS